MICHTTARYLALALVCLAGTPLAAEERGEQRFQQQVWPLLQSRCLSCHGPEEQEGDLRLDSRDAVLRGGEHGPAIVPGKAGESLLIKAVTHENAKLAMPPKEKLSDRDIELLRQWVDAGAVWPAAVPIATTERIGDAWHDQRNPIVRIFGGQRLELWSLQPVKRPGAPAVGKGHRIDHPMDAFIVARLEKEGLSLSPEADRRTLCRRVSFDLTGLPPTAEEVAAFVADSRPDAYERLVERLLASPRYGEHAARMWLDVVRYSDSNGFDWDEFRPRAWLFRDYVIRSLNADKPFDQFIREQLAGDELLSGPPKNMDEQDALIATTYLRLGPQDNSAALFNEQSRSRAEWMADLVETTGSAFLGLTFSCCRCHDHKHDPLSQADHFRLRAFFEPLKYADDLPINLAGEQQAIRQHNGQLDVRIAQLEEQRQKVDEGVKQRLGGEPSSEAIQAAFTPEEQQHKQQLEEQIKSLAGQKRSLEYALLATDQPGDVPVTRILYQGDYKAEREPVTPGFLSVLDPNPAAITAAPNQNTHGRRLALARWIASADNPLTARVLVNRVWQQHFGQGLVATPNDFGLAGARPSHPELLDWLADEFVREGWSLKRLHFQIVTSSTYRQSSASDGERQQRDPKNELLSRQNLRRLQAEQLRDALLATAGLLNPKVEGKPVWPELPPEVLQANPAFLDDNAMRTKGWYPSPAEEQDARTIFLIQKRTVRIPFLETFDLPENATSCARRNVSTVAPQAFSLLNSPLAVRAAKAFAQRVQDMAGEDVEAQVRTVFSLALQRAPAEQEAVACQAFARQHGLAALCRAMLNLNEFAYRD